MSDKGRRPDDTGIFPVPAWTRAVMAAVWISVVLLFWINRDRFTVDGVVSLSPDSRILAVLILLGLFALKSLSIVMYAGVLYAAGGLLFPLPMAVMVNIAGTAVMVSIPYLFGRSLGAPALVRLRERYPKLTFIQGLHRDNDFFYSLLLRSLTFLPSDIVSLYLGAEETRYGVYLLGSITGLLAPCILFPILGMNITDPSSPPFLIAVAIQAAITVGAFVGFQIIRKRADDRETADP